MSIKKFPKWEIILLFRDMKTYSKTHLSLPRVCSSISLIAASNDRLNTPQTVLSPIIYTKGHLNAEDTDL